MNERKPVVLVTGASGFVGRHVVPTLAREGWSVRRAVRRPEGMDDEVVIETIGPETDWQRRLKASMPSFISPRGCITSTMSRRSSSIATSTLLAPPAGAQRGDGRRAPVHLHQHRSRARSHQRRPRAVQRGRCPDAARSLRHVQGRGRSGLEDAGARQRHEDLGDQAAAGLWCGRQGQFRAADARSEPRVGAALCRDPQPARLPCVAEPVVVHPAPALSSSPASNFEIFLVADIEQVSTPEFIARLAKAAGKNSRLFGMPPDLLGTLLRVMGRQDTHDSLIGSLELNLAKAIATGWQSPRCLSTRGCGWRWRLRTPEDGRTAAAQRRSR